MPELDRRPIATRDTRFAKTVARWLAATGITPNQISVLSIVFSGLAGVALMAGGHGWRWGFGLAAGGIQLRLLCNLFDGMVAVEHGKKSAVGGLFNELPDRISDILIFMGAAVCAGHRELGLWTALLAVMTAYVRTLATHVGAEPDFVGPMAKQQRAAAMTGTSLAAFAFPGWAAPLMTGALAVIAAGSAVTCVRRFTRAMVSLNSKA
jgi:phosphatidylglycerophosphate synthase